MAAKGYIKIYRQLQNHWLWQEKRVFSKAEAWIDLIFMANHQDGKFVLGNELISVSRGEVITSEVKLMERWGWSKSKVRAFLDLLQSDSMIVKKTDRKKTRINIVNYDVYQDSQTTKELIKNHEQTASRPPADTINNEKNEKNDKNEKVKCADYVFLTPAEHERLINEFGQADTSRMIEILDNYIGQNPTKNGKRYTDHNRVIRGWVKDRLTEEKAKNKAIQSKKINPITGDSDGRGMGFYDGGI